VSVNERVKFTRHAAIMSFKKLHHFTSAITLSNQRLFW